MRTLRALLLMLLCIVQPLHAQGVGTTPELANRQLPDPAKETAATELMHSLRCIQCQGQSIHDSDAPIAAAMRHEVRERVAAGQSNSEIEQWLKGRYGDWISFSAESTLMTPRPFSSTFIRS